MCAGARVRAHTMSIFCFLRKGTLERPCTPFWYVRTQRKALFQWQVPSSYQLPLGAVLLGKAQTTAPTQRSSSQTPRLLAGALIFDFAGSRIARNKLLLLVSHLVSGILWQQPKQTELSVTRGFPLRGTGSNSLSSSTSTTVHVHTSHPSRLPMRSDYNFW